MDKKNFVAELGKILAMAKPNLVKCEYFLGKEFENTGPFDTLLPEDEYVVVTCENGHRYFLNVSGNSLAAIGEEVFRSMVCK